jgi:hypothetical protein
MSSYKQYKLDLTPFQQQKLKTAFNTRTPISIQLKKEQYKNGTVPLLLTDRQLNKINKNENFILKLSQSQVRKMTEKFGGFVITLPAILGAIGAIAGTAGATSGIVKAVNDKTHQKKSEKEQLRHNQIMEAEQKKMAKALVQSRGSGLYLKQEGKGLFLKKLKKLDLPDQALSNYDIEKACKNIPYFRGVYMLNTLPNVKKKMECGVVNLDNDNGNGTHWVCYGEKSKIFPGIEIGVLVF